MGSACSFPADAKQTQPSVVVSVVSPNAAVNPQESSNTLSSSSSSPSSPPANAPQITVEPVTAATASEPHLTSTPPTNATPSSEQSNASASAEEDVAHSASQSAHLSSILQSLSNDSNAPTSLLPPPDVHVVDVLRPITQLPVIMQRPSVQARYIGVIDHDSDSESDEESDEVDEIITIEEEDLAGEFSFEATQTFLARSPGLAATSTFLEASPMQQDARSSLIASAPRRIRSLMQRPGGCLSLTSSPQRSSTFAMPPAPFYVLLVDEDERHALELENWLTRHRCDVTRVSDGQAAINICHQLMDDCRRLRRAEQRDSPVTVGRNISADPPHSEMEEKTQMVDSTTSSSAEDGEYAADVYSLSSIHLKLDLIISDSSAFTSHGSSLLDECQRHGWLQTIPICLMSQDASSAAIDRTIRRGARDHFHKPVKRAIIRATLKSLKESRSQSRKTSLLKEWRERYKKMMVNERKSAILMGANPLDFSATHLLNQNPSIRFEHNVDTSMSAGSARPDLVLLVGTTLTSELPRLESHLESMSDKYRCFLVQDLQSAASLLQNELTTPAIVIIDIDTFPLQEMASMRLLLETAERVKCSRVLLLPSVESAPSTSHSLSAHLIESYADFDAALQAPVGQDLFRSQLALITKRRQERATNALLQQEADQYKTMLAGVRAKRAQGAKQQSVADGFVNAKDDAPSLSSLTILSPPTKRNSLPEVIISLDLPAANFVRSHSVAS